MALYAASPSSLALVPARHSAYGLAIVGELLQAAEQRLTGEPYVEALVIAILLDIIVRMAWRPGPRWRPGIKFSAQILLEIAIVLLGAAVSLRTVLAHGSVLLLGIVAVVAVAIGTIYSIIRILGLPQRLAILVACGNSICGNSASTAAAPVIGADGAISALDRLLCEH